MIAFTAVNALASEVYDADNAGVVTAVPLTVTDICALTDVVSKANITLKKDTKQEMNFNDFPLIDDFVKVCI